MDLKLFFQYFYSQIGEEILTNLSLNDILALREVNKHFNQVLEDPKLWLRLFLLKCQLIKVQCENSLELLEWRELAQKSINLISRKKLTHLLQRQFLAISQFGTQESDIVQVCAFNCYRCNKISPIQSPLYFAFESKDKEMCEIFLTKRLKDHGGKIEAVEKFLSTYFEYFNLSRSKVHWLLKSPTNLEDLEDEFRSMLQLTIDYLRHSKTYHNNLRDIYHFCHYLRLVLRISSPYTIQFIEGSKPSELHYVTTAIEGKTKPADIIQE